MKLSSIRVRSSWVYSVVIIAVIFMQSGSVFAFQSDVLLLKSFSNAFVEVARNVTPAVVSIEATKTVQASRFRRGGEFDEFFRRFQPRRQGENYTQRGLGSGVIIDSEGYILTNNHVVENAIEILVTLPDKRHFEAVLVGADPRTDVALLKIDGTNLPFAKMGDSEKVQVGEWVIAIGTPFDKDLNHSVTAGIVSAIGRNLGIISNNYDFRIEDFIQTDAAINPGNSGGPLVNLDGEIIGINTAIMSSTGSYQGFGFAIPVNLVRNIADDLREHGKSVRGIMGIQFSSIEDHETMRNYKLDNPYGAVITDFTSSDSPAEKAGIRIDDVIVAIDNQQFTRGGQLQTLLAGKNPGDRIKVTISRGGNKRNIFVTLGEMPEEETVPLIANTLTNREIGITVQEADDGRRLRRGEPRGVLVIGVSRNSSADDQNINIGDYIFKIDKTEINSLDDFQKAMDRYRNQRSVVFYIRNDKGTDLKNIRLR